MSAIKQEVQVTHEEMAWGGGGLGCGCLKGGGGTCGLGVSVRGWRCRGVHKGDGAWMRCL